jgi:trk system potassium uptake protein
MFVLIAGGGRTGTHLASLLVEHEHEVRLIEHRPEVLIRLHRELPTEVIYEGVPTLPGTLESAGIKEANVLAACTAVDADNLAICFLARSHYQVARTIARINNPRNAWLFDDTFHVDVALNQAEILASLIQEEMSLGDMMTLLKLRRGHYSLVEEKIPATARAVGKSLQELVLPDECVVAAVIRDGKMIVPRGNTTLEPDDEVLAVTTPEGAEQLASLFARH